MSEYQKILNEWVRSDQEAVEKYEATHYYGAQILERRIDFLEWRLKNTSMTIIFLCQELAKRDTNV